MNKHPQEVKFGDGGYILPGADDDRFGDILPLEDGYSYEDAETGRGELGPLHEDSTQQERIIYVHENYRFYPKSPEELSAIVGIDGARGSSAAKYLSIIMQHQENLEIKAVDPTVTDRTARRLTSDFIKYRDDSRAVSTFLKYVDEEISGVGNHSDMANLLRSYGGGDRRALAQAIRREEIADFADGDETDEKHSFLKDSECIELLDYYIANSDVADFRGMTEDALEEERRRYNYWNEKIKELKLVTTVSNMARRALGEI